MTLAILWDLKRQKLLSCDNLWKLRGAGGPSVGLPWDENYLLIMNRLLRVWKPPTLMITNRYWNFVNYLLKIIIVFLTQKFSKIIQQHPPRGKFPSIILILAFSWFSESAMASVCCAPFGCNVEGEGAGAQLLGQQRLIDRLSPPHPPAQPPPLLIHLPAGALLPHWPRRGRLWWMFTFSPTKGMDNIIWRFDNLLRSVCIWINANMLLKSTTNIRKYEDIWIATSLKAQT